MADGKTGKTLNLTEGNPLKLILLFAIPVFLGRLFQMMYSLIDTKIVGSILGEEALAAVGSVSILYNLLTGIFSGFTLGFSIVTAQNYGSGNEKLLKKNVASSIMLGMMTAVVIIFAVLLFLNPILHAMNVPEEQFCMAHDYIRILVWGMFVTLAYNLCADMLRA
ncbi:MAG: MATE family efflux transporter, partial [Roseburia inulinivorans]|nr:MATE family efflux transporter [Roseburia inulinivorans]